MMSDLDYIKKFSKIKVSRICREHHISSSNLWSGRLKPDKVHLIRKAIESEVGDIYIEEYKTLKGNKE